jgi:hypothetical protein
MSNRAENEGKSNDEKERPIGTIGGELEELFNGELEELYVSETKEPTKAFKEKSRDLKNKTKLKRGPRLDTQVGSFNLTDEASKALATLQKKTGKSKKEIVSASLISTLKGAVDQPVLKFNLPDPEEIMLLRSEIVELEFQANRLTKAIHQIRPVNKDQAKEVAKAMIGMQEHLKSLQVIDGMFKQKQHLLEGLTVAEYQSLGKLLPWFEQQRVFLKTKTHAPVRIARLDLMEQIVRLIISSEDL